jgi:predicted permease
LYLGLLVFICSFLAIILEYLNRIYFQIKNSKRVIYEKTKNL